jgi:predicted outer membrane protein
MASEHIRNMARLRILSGAVFDRAFVEAMVEEHEKVRRTVNDELLPRASNTELKAFILKMQPVLSKEVQMGREWLDRHRG